MTPFRVGLAVVLVMLCHGATAGFVFVPPTPPEEPVVDAAVRTADEHRVPPVSEVTGDIEVIAVRRERSVETPTLGAVSISAPDAVLDAALRETGGARLLVMADGSVSGATAARRVLGRCAALGRVCHVEYRGAKPGTVQIAKGN